MVGPEISEQNHHPQQPPEKEAATVLQQQKRKFGAHVGISNDKGKTGMGTE